MKTRAIAASTTMIGACLAFSHASVKTAHGVPLGFTIPKKTLSPDGRYGVIVPNLDHYDGRRTQNELIDLTANPKGIGADRFASAGVRKAATQRTDRFWMEPVLRYLDAGVDGMNE